VCDLSVCVGIRYVCVSLSIRLTSDVAHLAHALMCVLGECTHVPVCVLVCTLAGMSADVPSNPAVGLLWISSRLQGMGIPFPFTALPGRKKGKDAFSLLPSQLVGA